jgi:hypothetical protein
MTCGSERRVPTGPEAKAAVAKAMMAATTRTILLNKTVGITPATFKRCIILL